MGIRVFIVSDSTGDTADKVLAAAMRQFYNQDIVTEIFSRVRSDDEIETIIDRAVDAEALVVHTMVDARTPQLTSASMPRS